MVSRGGLAPLVLLSQQNEPRILDCIAATIQRLSLDVPTRRKTINDGAIKVRYHHPYYYYYYYYYYYCPTSPGSTLSFLTVIT